MPNQVEETLRVLNVEESSLLKQGKEYQDAYNEFIHNSKDLKHFNTIEKLLKNVVEIYALDIKKLREYREKLTKQYNIKVK